MFDNYTLEQPIVYKILTNSIKKNKYSHAYLFELNGYSKGLDLAIAFAKFLLCPHNYSNNNECNDCPQCHNIDSNNFLELKIIEADGQWIKKEQLEELQREFITKPLIGSKKIYIINGAEKLNVSASNSLLKFIEEPPEGVVAILLTDNIYQLLNTIVSRCQIISFKKNNYVKCDDYITKIAYYLFNDKESMDNFINDYGQSYLDFIDEYITFLENKKMETIIYKNKNFIDLFNDRKKINIAFQLMTLYYKDILNYHLGLPIEFYGDYIDSIKKISSNVTDNYLSNIIKIIVDLNILIKYNINANLIIDKLVIKISEVK